MEVDGLTCRASDAKQRTVSCSYRERFVERKAGGEEAAAEWESRRTIFRKLAGAGWCIEKTT